MCTVKTQECIGALRRVCMKRTQGSDGPVFLSVQGKQVTHMDAAE